jgi:hypothetical protein
MARASMSSSGAYGSTGYTCNLCGAFVGFNTTHYCSGYAPSNPGVPASTVYITTPVDLKPLLDKLDELIKSIETLADLVANSD